MQSHEVLHKQSEGSSMQMTCDTMYLTLLMFKSIASAVTIQVSPSQVPKQSSGKESYLQDLDRMVMSLTVLNGYFVVTLSYFLMTISYMLKL